MVLYKRLIAPSVGLLQWIASQEWKKKLQKAEQASRFDLFYFFPFYYTINYLRGVDFNTESHAVSSCEKWRILRGLAGWEPRGVILWRSAWYSVPDVLLGNGTAKNLKRFASCKCSKFSKKWWTLRLGKNTEILFGGVSVLSRLPEQKSQCANGCRPKIRSPPLRIENS